MKLIAYRTEQFEIDLRRGEFVARGKVVHLEPQVYILLIHLIANKDRIITIDELLDVVWNGRIVSEATVLSRISAARSAIGDTGREQRFIRTFRKRGFRYIGPVEAVPDSKSQILPDRSLEFRSVPTAEHPDKIAVVPDQLSIAVFPFEPIASEFDQQFLATGLAADIATDLSRNGTMFVIAPAATAGMQDTQLNMQFLAERLGVRYILKGYLAYISKKIRLNVQLHDALDMRLVWAERFQCKFQDILESMDKIVNEVAQRLVTDLPQLERHRALRIPELQLRAYEHVLRGDYHHARMTREGNIRAISSYRKAIALDALNAPAFAGLAWAQNHHGNQGWSTHRQASISHAFMNANRAVELEGRLAKAYSVMGDIQLWNRNHNQSIDAGRRAINCDPSHADSRMIYSYCLAMAGNAKESLTQARLALRSNPVRANRIYFSALGHACYLNDDYIGTRRAMESGVKLDARHRGLRLLHAVALFKLGDIKAARSETSIALNLDPNLRASTLSNLWPYKSVSRLDEFGELLQSCGLPG